MGFRFIHYDLKTGNLLKTLGYAPGQLHFVIFSAVMEMCVRLFLFFYFCSSTLKNIQRSSDVSLFLFSSLFRYVANAVSCNWLAKLLLEEGVHAAMVDSRSQKLKAHRMMEQRGGE
jgi:hypothetical protein